MTELSTQEIYWIQQVSLGPCSYVANYPHDKRTHCDNVTMQASTYIAMMRCGWVTEVV